MARISQVGRNHPNPNKQLYYLSGEFSESLCKQCPLFTLNPSPLTDKVCSGSTSRSPSVEVTNPTRYSQGEIKGLAVCIEP